MLVEFDLSVEEYEVLAAALDSYLSDLRMEIANTDRKDFRDMLKQQKEVITRVLDILNSAGAATQSGVRVVGE